MINRLCNRGALQFALGIIDDLKGVGKAAKDRDIWFHVDGAYGLAALCAPSVRVDFDGVENADSFIVDPHKWLFAPFDACALVYRNPELAKEAHSQHASYLDTLKDDQWSPSDYAINLTRRTRGLPFWFSLAAHGTDAYTEAMEQNEIIQSTESVPKTLSPRIRNNNSRDSTHKKRKQTDEDSPVQKIMINQQSSNSNFHEADHLGLSEELVLDRRMLE